MNLPCRSALQPARASPCQIHVAFKMPQDVSRDHHHSRGTCEINLQCVVKRKRPVNWSAAKSDDCRTGSSLFCSGALVVRALTNPSGQGVDIAMIFRAWQNYATTSWQPQILPISANVTVFTEMKLAGYPPLLQEDAVTSPEGLSCRGMGP